VGERARERAEGDQREGERARERAALPEAQPESEPEPARVSQPEPVRVSEPELVRLRGALEREPERAMVRLGAAPVARGLGVGGRRGR